MINKLFSHCFRHRVVCAASRSLTTGVTVVLNGEPASIVGAGLSIFEQQDY